MSDEKIDKRETLDDIWTAMIRLRDRAAMFCERPVLVTFVLRDNGSSQFICTCDGQTFKGMPEYGIHKAFCSAMSEIDMADRKAHQRAFAATIGVAEDGRILEPMPRQTIVDELVSALCELWYAAGNKVLTMPGALGHYKARTRLQEALDAADRVLSKVEEAL